MSYGHLVFPSSWPTKLLHHACFFILFRSSFHTKFIILSLQKLGPMVCLLSHLLSLCLLCLSASLSDSSLWLCLLSADPLSAVRRGCWRLSADWLVRRLSADWLVRRLSAVALDWRLSADRLAGSLSAAEALMISADLLVRSLSAEALDCRLSANKLGCLSTSRLAEELVFTWFLYLADRSPPVVRDVLNKTISQNK